ncbi:MULTISPECIES: M23 family metallopeptidase [unclassified Veillonella]|jgi:peptidase, M23 family|uniref:M23 family metallopeptidase n=1 Tax=unclassified Veillonella TaxID=2630086 RepID=UPI00021A2CB4|nr:MULTISPECIES: M23 family metallopeptidase [unclassified Veillonella]EGS34984.1 peptidase, M23 family [Veillonella sp. oral taxon 780 str. F0422]KXB87757.1 peptidase, M23 family [Veillonella sp. DNF00869]MBS6626601.1 M23 family metallopeptidase [Veillonella sp. oral taxon 780]
MQIPKWLQSHLKQDGNDWNLQFTKQQIKTIAIILIAILVIFLGFGIWGIARQVEVLQLRQENQLQKEQLRLLDQKVEVLDKKMKTLDELDQNIRNMIKGTESGTLQKADGNTQNKEEKEDPSPKSSNKTFTTTQLSARISSLDRQAQRRMVSMYTLYNVLREGVGKDIRELQSLLAMEGDASDANSHMPSIWPAKGVISSTFGARQDPVYGGGAFHEGLDIANDTGTTIVATAAGTVTYAAYAGGYGNLIEIDHGNGFITKYGHNSALLVQAGMTVKKGQSIALMGSTGKSTGSHVHYEVRVNGVATDPLLFLPIQ